jgi:gamma-glutamyl:cysteine ligase YbdK (ATP-grasp superfamily)
MNMEHWWKHTGIKKSKVLREKPSLLLSTTNKMQRFIIFFITVYALHVSGGFSAHHQELKNCTHGIWYVPGLLAATASSSSKRYP